MNLDHLKEILFHRFQDQIAHRGEIVRHSIVSSLSSFFFSLQIEVNGHRMRVEQVLGHTSEDDRRNEEKPIQMEFLLPKSLLK